MNKFIANTKQLDHPFNPNHARTHARSSGGWVAIGLALLVLAARPTLGQVIVNDPWQLVQQSLELTRQGDPALIQSVSGAGQVISSLGRTGVDKPLAQMQQAANGLSSLAYDGNGIYQVVESYFVTPDGRQHTRDIPGYAKFDAVNKVSENFTAVLADTEQRRQELRAAIKTTTRAAETAITVAEGQKLATIATVQNAEMGAIDKERDAALAKVVVQEIQNRAQEARDQKVQTENQVAGFRAAVGKLLDFVALPASAKQNPTAIQSGY